MATPTYIELRDDFLTCLQTIGQNGQHMALNGRVFTKADLKEVRETLDWLDTKISINSSGGIFDRMKTGVPYRA